MKQRITVLCLAVLLVAFTASCQAGGTGREGGDTTANTNSPAKSDTKAEIRTNVEALRAVLLAHDKALSEKNLDAVMATFSSDPTTVMMGTGSEERWMGPQEIRSAYTEIFKDYDANTLQTDCSGWKTGAGDGVGKMAWLAAVCTAKDSFQGKVRDYKLNVTATLANQDGNWRFVSLHMSNAFQPPVTK